MKKDELGSVVNDDRAIGNKVQSCQRCGKGPIVVDSSGGEMTCSHCGFVIVDKIEEEGPEWRAFSKEEKDDRSRTGVPSSLAMHDMGLATVIGAEDRDAAGRALPSTMKAAIERAKRTGKLDEPFYIF